MDLRGSIKKIEVGIKIEDNAIKCIVDNSSFFSLYVAWLIRRIRKVIYKLKIKIKRLLVLSKTFNSNLLDRVCVYDVFFSKLTNG